jgi:hypothetical protein
LRNDSRYLGGSDYSQPGKKSSLCATALSAARRSTTLSIRSDNTTTRESNTEINENLAAEVQLSGSAESEIRSALTL